ncbi:unnamed protein product [Diamesa serratosioi]
MSVYSYDKSFLLRLEEFELVLGEETSSSAIRKKFIEFIEMAIEPAGYQAVWKLSKSACEDFGVMFPTEVFGQVDQVLFDELKCVFSVWSVHDDNIHLPESNVVPLEDIFPTKAQENNALNVDITADCIDRLRFFYNYIWMPWDEESEQDYNWTTKCLIPRMKLYFDLKNKSIGKGLSSHIRSLILEAKYIHKRRENLETSMEEESDDFDISKDKGTGKSLLELHLRLNRIKHEIEILVNPEMREIYENLMFPHRLEDCEAEKRKIFAIAKSGMLSEQEVFISQLKLKIPCSEAKVLWTSSLHEAISNASNASEIYIPSGKHSMKFLEYLNDNLLFSGMTAFNKDQIVSLNESEYAVISATENASLLFASDGDLRIENLIINCENVKNGFLIRNGKVTIKNCLIIGNNESSVTEGISIYGTAEVLIENSVVCCFATGITATDQSRLTIKNTLIRKCNNGINIFTDTAMVTMDKSSIVDCLEFGILKYSAMLSDNEKKNKVLDSNKTMEMEEYNIYTVGECKFEGNKCQNIIVSSKSEVENNEQ